MQREAVSRGDEKTDATYELRVLLMDTEPLVWRRLQVPGAANLGWLHGVLQVAMGWTNSHLHQFLCEEHTYSDPSAGLDEFEGDPPVLNEHKFTIAALLPHIGQGLVYEYDFGDSWEHIVTVERILPANPSRRPAAVCLGGFGACPPEDCGGAGGYLELLKVLKNKKHPEHKSTKEWLGRPFDPETFDVAKTNHWLRKLKWPSMTVDQLGKVLAGRDGCVD